MEVTIFDTLAFEKQYLLNANTGRHKLTLLDLELNELTVELAKGGNRFGCDKNSARFWLSSPRL